MITLRGGADQSRFYSRLLLNRGARRVYKMSIHHSVRPRGFINKRFNEPGRAGTPAFSSLHPGLIYRVLFLITIWIGTLPSPMVSTHFIDSVLRLPTKQRFGTPRVCIADGHIAGSTLGDLVANFAARGFFKS